MHMGICKRCGKQFYESKKGAREEDLCDDHLDSDDDDDDDDGDEK
jgi:hypothetical protein